MTKENGTLVNTAHKDVKLINLTPHDVNLILPDESTLTIPASGSVARVGSHVEQVGTIGIIPVVKTVFDTVVTDLPDPQDGVIYLTSTLVAQAVPDRTDVLVPADLRRDEAGRIIGCGALQRLVQAAGYQVNKKSQLQRAGCVQTSFMS